jgi:hypothetical protein
MASQMLPYSVEEASMNSDLIRTVFIRNNLEEARRHVKEPIAIRTAREFRTYLDWHADTLPEPDRKAISELLGELESSLALTAPSGPRDHNNESLEGAPISPS